MSFIDDAWDSVTDWVDDAIDWVDDAIDETFDFVADVGEEIGPYIPFVADIYAGKEAKELAEQNARKIQMETDRAAGVLETQNRRRAALARAKAAASGLGGDTPDIYIQALETAGREEISWLRQVGLANYELAMSEGELAFDKSIADFVGQVGTLALGAFAAPAAAAAPAAGSFAAPTIIV